MVKKLIKRVVMGLAALLVLGASGLAIAVAVRQNRTFEAPYPDIHASSDPAVIERGRYLAFGAAHCVSCHGDDLSGGHAFELPVGTFRTPNLTPDPTGIAKYTDGELARALRYGVHPSGRAMLPFMPFSDLSDADLTAVLSYARSVRPVHNEVPAHDVTLLGRFAKAFILEPHGPTRTPPKDVAPAVNAEYGAYLARSVGNCIGCHTKRSMRTGEDLGPELAGGMELESETVPGKMFISPNLTPDPATGHLTQWTEDQFVARFANAVATDSPMPWARFRTITEGDLRALYRYLRSLPPSTAPGA